MSLAECLCSVLGVSRCAVYLRERRRGPFRGRLAYPLRRREADEWMRRSVAGGEADRFSGEIVRTRRPVLVTDARRDPRCVRQAMVRWDIRAMLGVPMLIEDDVIGLVFLDNAGQPYAYTRGVQRAAAKIVNLAAIAVAEAQHASEREALARSAVERSGATSDRTHSADGAATAGDRRGYSLDASPDASPRAAEGQSAASLARGITEALERDAAGDRLLATVVAYLESNRHVRRTARRLEVHENTVRHRLRRVRALTGLDIQANPDHAFMAQLALYAMRPPSGVAQPGHRTHA